MFADNGLSDAEISALFLIWSLVGIVAEVPTGALADRFSRRGALAAGGVLQAVGLRDLVGPARLCRVRRRVRAVGPWRRARLGFAGSVASTTG